jgi:hypothetical protein
MKISKEIAELADSLSLVQQLFLTTKWYNYHLSPSKCVPVSTTTVRTVKESFKVESELVQLRLLEYDHATMLTYLTDKGKEVFKYFKAYN